MCNCIEETKETAIAHIAKKSTDKDFKILDADFQNVPAFVFGGSIKMYAEFKYRYTFTRVNGETSSTKTKKTNIFFTFCPFCGKKYDE